MRELVESFDNDSYRKTIDKILNSKNYNRQSIIENTRDYFDINNAKKNIILSIKIY